MRRLRAGAARRLLPAKARVKGVVWREIGAVRPKQRPDLVDRVSGPTSASAVGWFGEEGTDGRLAPVAQAARPTAATASAVEFNERRLCHTPSSVLDLADAAAFWTPRLATAL